VTRAKVGRKTAKLREVRLDAASLPAETKRRSTGAWQGVAMDCLTVHPGLPCPTLERPAGGLRPSLTLLDTPRRTPMLTRKGNFTLATWGVTPNIPLIATTRPADRLGNGWPSIGQRASSGDLTNLSQKRRLQIILYLGDTEFTY
jgi:hypothetical protein